MEYISLTLSATVLPFYMQVSGFCSDRCSFKFCQCVKIPGKQSILLHKISSRTWTTLSQNVCIFIHVIGTRLLTLSPALLLFSQFCFFLMRCVIKKQITFLISFSMQNAFCLSCSVISGLKEGSKCSAFQGLNFNQLKPRVSCGQLAHSLS